MKSSDWPPKFTLDTKKILELFTSGRFYSSADAAIREAVLNAIDACGRRQAADRDILPDIDVIFDDQTKTVTISDNGDGMGQEELGELFTKVGATASEIVQLIDEAQYKAIGEFGIGVVSYFLVCDRYEVHTVLQGGGKPLGLEFTSKMLDGKTRSHPLSPKRTESGTTLVLFVRDDTLFQRLLDRFGHWIRDVQGLRATKLPNEVEIPQGGLSAHIQPVDIESPDWVEWAQLGPPLVFEDWYDMDGKGHVDVLYRGVFVDRVDVDGLWGIEGSINVDPKHFKHRLNREGFADDKIKEEVTRFLQAIHPPILQTALDCLRDVLADEQAKEWTLQRLATLWLAVPQSSAYTKVSQAWDEEFRIRKVFRLLRADDQESDVSVNDLQELGVETIYLAPHRLDRTNDIVRQAVRILRAKGLPVVQGIERDTGYLSSAPISQASTANLLVDRFRDMLPNLTQVENVAQKIVAEESVAEIFELSPRVRLMHLGVEAVPLVSVGDEIWINIEVNEGKRIIREICDRNEGHLGLWVACLKYAPGHAHKIANLLKDTPETTTRLGLVQRQYLRGLTT